MFKTSIRSLMNIIKRFQIQNMIIGSINYRVGIVFMHFILMMVFESCDSQNRCPPCPAQPPVNPNINFKLIDNSTGQDLFFGNQAKYSTSQIHVHHIINGKPDTAYLIVNSTDGYFNLNVPTVHVVDTVQFQIASQAPDIFLFYTSSLNRCCPFIKHLDRVNFDGVVVYPGSGASPILEIKK